MINTFKCKLSPLSHPKMNTVTLSVKTAIFCQAKYRVFLGEIEKRLPGPQELPLECVCVCVPVKKP